MWHLQHTDTQLLLCAPAAITTTSTMQYTQYRLYRLSRLCCCLLAHHTQQHSSQDNICIGCIIGVAQFLDACLERLYNELPLSWSARHLISPKLAGKDVLQLE